MPIYFTYYVYVFDVMFSYFSFEYKAANVSLYVCLFVISESKACIYNRLYIVIKACGRGAAGRNF